MRTTVIERLREIAEHDERIALITGDSGFHVVEPFIEKYPKRCFNMGINEQATASIAAGMALEGYKVYIYGIGNFPTLRCLEQIRNDICYHNANVTILAPGGGFAYGQQGMSHHATEELSAMRPYENMHLYMPADQAEAIAAIDDSYEYEGPSYIRLGRGQDKLIYQSEPSINVAKAVQFYPAQDINIFTSGTILCEAVAARKELRSKGIKVGLYSFPRVKPIDAETIENVARNGRIIITLEEHSIIGGFGSAVAEIVSGLPGARARVVRLGLNDEFTSVVGSQEYLRDYYGISARALEKQIAESLQGEIGQ